METLYCHPELVSGSLDILIYIDSEIPASPAGREDSERDAEINSA
ncbi:MAG: hypothetical protein V3U40_03040 [Candidatus Scalindua sediminis]